MGLLPCVLILKEAEKLQHSWNDLKTEKARLHVLLNEAHFKVCEVYEVTEPKGHQKGTEKERHEKERVCELSMACLFCRKFVL